VIPILVSVVGLLAVVAWIVAVVSAVRIIGLAPRGQRIRNYVRLGWWQFADIRQDLGPAVDLHIRTYQRAFVVFFACIFAGMAVGIIATMAAPRPAA
jgi:hypothetical protein